MSFSRRDLGYLEDVLGACREVQEYVANATQEQFRDDRVLHNAVIQQITIIGEAADHLSDEFIESQPAVPWKEIVGMRHMLVHGYREVRLDEVWNTATVDVPALIAALEPLLPPPPTD